jgi:hypothetical protein
MMNVKDAGNARFRPLAFRVQAAYFLTSALSCIT